MIRFRVVKGSHILLALSIIALSAVLALILLSELQPSDRATIQPAQAAEAKAASAFASASETGFQIEVLPDPSPTPPACAGKRILIYHTHSHEAYTQAADDPYVAVEAWRTEDSEHSVVRLGRALSDELRSLGCEVIHDETDHEQQDISGAYQRSLETLEGYDADFDLIIDLHRDAHVEGLPLSFDAGGQSLAQLMLLVGRGDDYTGDDRPDYEGNLAFAQALTQAMNAQHPGICRNVTVKKGRYNQHMGDRAILVEVGHNLNTLDEALASIPCLARAIYAHLE